jgi:hypothetical protein
LKPTAFIAVYYLDFLAIRTGLALPYLPFHFVVRCSLLLLGMKIASALCAALLLGFSSKAQTVTGSFNGGSASTNWYYTPPTVVPVVASSCAAPKVIAGPFTANATTEVRYATYTFANAGTAPACITLTLTPACTQSTTSLLLTVFKGTYFYGGVLNVPDFTANYLGDAGAYSAGPTSCSILVGGGQRILAVVNTNGPSPTVQSCSGYTLTATNAAVVPLPVNLSSFKGQATPTGNALEWATASEQGNLGFVVERSSDGQHFGPLGRVAGAGTRSYTSTYTYLDATPVPLSYYRLRQQDISGGEHFSPVVVVQTTGTLAFFPNPVLAEATFSSPVATRLTVRDALGRTCQVLPLVAGSQQVSLATLPAGVYAVTNEATHQTMRLVKANQQ